MSTPEPLAPGISLSGEKAQRDTLLLIRRASAEDTSLASFRIETLSPNSTSPGGNGRGADGPVGQVGTFGKLGEVLWTSWAFVVALLSFTPSNLALLCCAAGALGATGRRLKLSGRTNPETLDRSFPFLSAVIRGLVVFLIVISGLLVLLENPIVGTASPGQYVRFGGLLSLTSFVVSYDPSVFAMLLEQVRTRLRERTEGTSAEEKNSEDTKSQQDG